MIIKICTLLKESRLNKFGCSLVEGRENSKKVNPFYRHERVTQETQLLVKVEGGSVSSE